MKPLTREQAHELAVHLNNCLAQMIDANDKNLSILKDLAWMARLICEYTEDSERVE